jgi:hypothetical protein
MIKIWRRLEEQPLFACAEVWCKCPFPADRTIRWRDLEGQLRVDLTRSIDAGPMAVVGRFPAVDVRRDALDD